MNTERYKVEYVEQVIELLKSTPNPVHLPSDVFFKIGKQFEGEPDREKLSALLRKTYTVMAVEDEKLVGLAGMDKEGNIGIFAASENPKAQKLLLSALDRRAEKTEVPQLFVQPFDDARDLFIRQGYEPLNEGDDFNLIKKIASKDEPALAPEDAKSFTLDPKAPIVVEGKQSVFPFFFFGISCFFVFLLVLLTATKYRNAFAENDRNYIVVFIAVTVLFCAALAILIGYFIRRANLKKEVLSMRITNGCITSFSTVKTRDHEDGHLTNSTRQAAYTRVFLRYAFYDENGTLREEEFTHRYRFSGPYFYEGQELIIAHSRKKSYILNKYTILDAPEPEEEPHEDVSDLTKSVSAKRLSAYVPIKAAKIYYGYALCYLCGFAILFAFFLAFGIIAAKYTHRPVFGQIAHQLLFGSPFLIVFGGLTIYAISIPLLEKSKYKKLLASPDVQCTHGKIVHADKTYKNDNKMRFYCKFSDGTEKRSVLVPYRSASNLVKSNNTSVLVVFNRTSAVVLVKKGAYPDKFSFGYYRD